MEEAYNAFLGVPIIHQRRVLGVLCSSGLQRRFDASEEAFLVTLFARSWRALLPTPRPPVAWRALGAAGASAGMHASSAFPGRREWCTQVAVAPSPPRLSEAVPDQKSDDVAQELESLHRALRAARQDIAGLGAQLQDRLNAQEGALFDAYLPRR